MIEPDRARVDLDLEDGGEVLRLWYPNGALRLLTGKLGIELRMHEVAAVLDSLRTDTLALFVWAGRLWSEDEKSRGSAPEPKISELQRRLDWSPLPPATIARAVSDAIGKGVFGAEAYDRAEKQVSEEAAAAKEAGAGNGTDPSPTTKMTEPIVKPGTGTKPSVLA